MASLIDSRFLLATRPSLPVSLRRRKLDAGIANVPRKVLLLAAHVKTVRLFLFQVKLECKAVLGIFGPSALGVGADLPIYRLLVFRGGSMVAMVGVATLPTVDRSVLSGLPSAVSIPRTSWI